MRVTHPPLSTRAGDHLTMRVEKQRPLTRCPQHGCAPLQGSGRAFSLSEARPAGHFHPGPAHRRGAGGSLAQFSVHLGRTGSQRRAEPSATVPLRWGMATTSTDSPGQGCSPERLASSQAGQEEIPRRTEPPRGDTERPPAAAPGLSQYTHSGKCHTRKHTRTLQHDGV